MRKVAARVELEGQPARSPDGQDPLTSLFYLIGKRKLLQYHTRCQTKATGVST
jgi:hypothetical protein